MGIYIWYLRVSYLYNFFLQKHLHAWDPIIEIILCFFSVYIDTSIYIFHLHDTTFQIFIRDVCTSSSFQLKIKTAMVANVERR